MTLTVVRADTGGWIFSWSAGTPPYSIWLDGILLTKTTDLTYNFTTSGYDDVPPDLEVLDSTEDAGNELYSPYLLFQWRGIIDSLGYVVQKYISGEWVDQGTLTENGKGYYTWQTEAQDDGASLSYRVLAVAANGTSGSSINFQVTMVRNPIHPTVSLHISTSGNLVVS